MHKNLVGRFFGNAKKMLRVDGQIHVTHKITLPYGLWDLVGLGSRNSLICFECSEFKIENYPGYNNKRGAGSKCDEPFPLGECNTFKFRFDPSRKNVPRTKRKKRFLHAPSQNLQTIPNSISPPIYSLHPAHFNDMNGLPSHAGLPARHDPRSELFRIFKPYFSDIRQTFGRMDIHVEVSVRQALHNGALMFRDETGRPLGDYLEILAELHCWSRSRILKLQQKLQDLDRRLIEQHSMGHYDINYVNTRYAYASSCC